jgi:vancomycin resistance protein YoaR
VTTSPPTSLAEDLADASRPGDGHRRGLLVGGVAVAAIAAVYLGLVATTGDGLPRGTTVLGVDVGGQSEAQAVATLESALGARATEPVAAVLGTDHVSVVPADAGLAFDAEATVAGLAGRVWNPVMLFQSFTGGPTLDPVVTVDDAKLAAEVASLAADSDSPAVEPTIQVTGTTATVNPGKNGTVLDQQASAEALAAAYLVSSDPVILPVVEAQPTVNDDAAQQALATAQAAVSSPFTVRVEDVTATIPPEAMGEALTFTAKDGALVPSLKGDVLRAAVAPALASVETPGRNASFAIKNGKPVVVPSRVGKGVNADLLATDVLAAVASGSSRSIEAQIGSIAPKLTTAQAKALGVTEQMSSFTQRFPYAAYRVQNIGQAARSINGTLLLPGQTFSLNKTLGERTVANGYTKGFVVGPGGVFKEDLGGGVSTSATTTWTAAFYAGLQRVHTQAHSIWISRYRAGLEATIAWGAFDMSFKNDTPHAVYITTIMKNTSITVTMWGTKVYDTIKAESGPRYNVVPPGATQYDPSPTCHAQSGVEGFSIDVYRVFIKDGKEVKREKITTRYRPSPTVLCKQDPAKVTPSPSPSASTTVKPSPSPTTTKPKTTPTPSPSTT